VRSNEPSSETRRSFRQPPSVISADADENSGSDRDPNERRHCDQVKEKRKWRLFNQARMNKRRIEAFGPARQLVDKRRVCEQACNHKQRVLDELRRACLFVLPAHARSAGRISNREWTRMDANNSRSRHLIGTLHSHPTIPTGETAASIRVHSRSFAVRSFPKQLSNQSYFRLAGGRAAGGFRTSATNVPAAQLCDWSGRQM
jgi:hypothetical protein